MDDAKIASTILEQLGGVGRLKLMTGARDILITKRGVRFKFPNRRGPNYVHITLDGDDTYTVRMARLVKLELRSESTVHGIYAGQLVELFENATGLALSL